jgi:hypothetical protein
MIFSNYCKTNNQKLINNSDAADAFDYLSSPEIVANMIAFTGVGLPAISGIAKELEEKYNGTSSFSLENPHNRQQVGKMVKYILSFFGYETDINGLEERAQLRQFSKSKLFKTAAVYRKTNASPLKKIQTRII